MIKIGSHLNIKNFIIHQLLKEQGDRNVRNKIAPNTLSITEKEKVFMANLDKSYHKKSSPIYGIFENGNGSFKQNLQQYIDEKIKFYDFSVAISNYYKKVLEGTANATGGYMILSEYFNEKNNCNFLLVLMINNKEGYVVNEKDLTLENIKNLDLSKVDVACLINLTEWQKIENDIETERKTYLSFVKGMKTISYYFLSFIDCDNKNTNTESTNRLITAIEAYADNKGYDRSQRTKKRNEIFEYCIECIDNKKEIHLSKISYLINPDQPDEFSDFATEDTYKVSSIISGDKSRMKTLKYITYSNKNFKLEFDSNMLKKDVIYNPKSNQLTFKNLPLELANKLDDFTRGAK